MQGGPRGLVRLIDPLRLKRWRHYVREPKALGVPPANRLARAGELGAFNALANPACRAVSTATLSCAPGPVVGAVEREKHMVVVRRAAARDIHESARYKRLCTPFNPSRVLE